MVNIIYFVEGECEQKLIKAFTSSGGVGFKPGKVNVLNFNNQIIKRSLALSIKKNDLVVIIIDTDIKDTKIIDQNISILLKHSYLTKDKIYIVMSVDNFEDELVYSCEKLSNIHDLFKTNDIKEFKTKFINRDNLKSKLIQEGFNIRKIFTRTPKPPFDKFINRGRDIKN